MALNSPENIDEDDSDINAQELLSTPIMGLEVNANGKEKKRGNEPG